MDHIKPSQPVSEGERTDAEIGEEAEIINRLGSYEEIIQKNDQYEIFLRNADESRESVQTHIYDKVVMEYSGKKAVLDEEQKKLEAVLQENLNRFLEVRERLNTNSQEASDNQEEISFRVRVGELSEDEVTKELKELNQRIREYTGDLARIEGILSKYTQVGLLQEQPSDEMPQKTSDTEYPRVQGGGEEEPEEFGEPSVEDDMPDSLPQELEASVEDFEVLGDESALTDEDCPVVHCPETLSQDSMEAAADMESSESGRDSKSPSNGYVTGYLVVIEGSRMGERFPLISSNITLGNSPGIDIRLSDSGISNFHSRILYKDRKHFLENLDPMGRSYVNGVHAELTELKDGDVLRLGESKMQVEYVPSNT